MLEEHRMSCARLFDPEGVCSCHKSVNDIVTRLRNRRGTAPALCDAAADEIERLRELHDLLAAQLVDARAEQSRLERELARLSG